MKLNVIYVENVHRTVTEWDTICTWVQSASKFYYFTKPLLMFYTNNSMHWIMSAVYDFMGQYAVCVMQVCSMLVVFG